MLKRVFCVLLCFSLIGIGISATASCNPPRYLEITFVTTNDLHCRLVPYDREAKKQATAAKNVGGAARRATVVKQIRSEMRTPVFLTDSGDATLGSGVALGKAYHGAADIAVMNAIGYDMMEPGNHEFQWEAPETLRNLKNSHFPWICANLVDTKTGKPYLTPYIIKDVWGVRVAFLGLMTQLTNADYYKATHELGLNAVDPIETAKKYVPELRQKADIVVVLSHMGYALDKTVAAMVPGIDIILGGHSHTRLTHPAMVSVGEPTAFSLGTVPVVQAYEWGAEMGRTQVIFRRDPTTGHYTLMSCKGNLILLDSSIPDDPCIAGIIRCYEAGIKEKTAKK